MRPAALRVLDYKTGTAFTEAAREEHRSQLRRYMRLLTQASGRSVAGTVVYLDEQRLEQISL
jgi:RecB family exonuclease